MYGNCVIVELWWQLAGMLATADWIEGGGWAVGGCSWQECWQLLIGLKGGGGRGRLQLAGVLATVLQSWRLWEGGMCQWHHGDSGRGRLQLAGVLATVFMAVSTMSCVCVTGGVVMNQLWRPQCVCGGARRETWVGPASQCVCVWWWGGGCRRLL